MKGKLAENYTGSVNYDGSTFNVKNGMVVQESVINEGEWYECDVIVSNSKTYETEKRIKGYINIPGLHLTNAQSNIFVCLGPVAANTRAYQHIGKTLNSNQMYIYINATSEEGEIIHGTHTVYYSFVLDGKEYSNSLPIEYVGSVIIDDIDYPHYTTWSKIVEK